MQTEILASPTRDLFAVVTELENPQTAIDRLALALLMMDMGGENQTLAAHQIAYEIQSHVRALDQVHEKLFRMTHPSAAKFNREGWPSDLRKAGNFGFSAYRQTDIEGRALGPAFV